MNITDGMADAARAVIERGAPCQQPCNFQKHQRAEMRAVLEAVGPSIRQQALDEVMQRLIEEGGTERAKAIVRELSECPSCHTRDGHPHTDYCKAVKA